MKRNIEITLGMKHNRISYLVTSLFCYFVRRKGFTLVELTVSVAITGILMLGISAFFSSSFQNLFTAQTETTNIENQYAINEIIRDKFLSLDKILNEFKSSSPQATEILYKNKSSDNLLPFSYIGETKIDKNNDGIEENYLAFKDFMIFNKVDSSESADLSLYGDSGSGLIKIASSGNPRSPNLNPDEFKNFAGFTYCKDKYYIALPDKNKIMGCSCPVGEIKCTCTSLDMKTQLFSPTDITCDDTNKFLYISDSGNSRVIEYEIGDGEKQTPVATGLNYPTGLAFYDDGATKWLFVADTLNNKIRKYNLTNRATTAVTVVGDGEDKECTHTAKFCKLSMPTGLFVDDDLLELYIADSGNNRILKMKDPGSPENLLFEFKLDENYALDRIEFENSAWDGNGTYDEDVSNLIGKSSNFTNKVFKNSDRLTTFVNGKCSSSINSFYVNEESVNILKGGNKIIVNSAVFTVNSVEGDVEGIECHEKDEDPSLKKWRINVNVAEDASSIGDGETVFFSNPKDVIVKINGNPNINFDKGGFQTFAIKTYDLMKGLVDTDYYSVRIGDDILGTDEDTIGVVVDLSNKKYSLISFPTGVTNKYFANSGAVFGNTKVVEMNPSSPKTLVTIDTKAFETFDYISDFSLADKDAEGHAINPIEFTKYNNENLLELVINAFINGNKTQTYKLNTVIPK